MGMLLIDGDVSGGAIHLGCRSHEETRRALILYGLANVEGPLHVGIDITVGCHIAVGYGDEGGEMEHRVGTLYESAAEIRVAHVAGHDLQFGVAYPFEPSPVVEGIILSESLHVATLAEKSLRKMAAYESVSSCHYYISHIIYRVG